MQHYGICIKTFSGGTRLGPPLYSGGPNPCSSRFVHFKNCFGYTGALTHACQHASVYEPNDYFFIIICFAYKSQYKRIRNQDETRQNQAPTPTSKCIIHTMKYMLKLKNATANTKTRNQAKPTETRPQTRHQITKRYVQCVFVHTKWAAHS